MKEKEKQELPIIDKATGKRTVFIVHKNKKKSLEKAQVLATKISGRANVKCSCLDENDFLQNKKASSDNILIFMEDIKGMDESRKLAGNARDEKEYGIHYGWSGRRAFIWVEDMHLSEEQIKKLISDYENEFGEFKQKKKSIKVCEDVAIAIAFGAIGLGSKYLIKHFINRNKRRGYILSLAIMKFYNKELDNFIKQAVEGNQNNG